MGALINIAYDSQLVTNENAAQLAENIQVFTKDVMGEKDVFVYADAKPITAGADPIEIFIQVNVQKMPDPAGLMERVAEKVSEWKQQNDFQQPINLNVIPVTWYSKVGI